MLKGAGFEPRISGFFSTTQTKGGILSRPWSDEEVKFLLKNHKQMSCMDIAKELGRSKGGIRNLARSMNLNFKPNQKKWTSKDNEFLISSENKRTAKEIADFLGFDAKAVRNKAKRWGIPLRRSERYEGQRPWTSEEIAYLSIKYKKVSTSEICKKLGRSENSVYRKARMLGLSNKVGKKKKWTREEDLFLINQVGKKSKASIAKELERTLSSVKRRVSHLGLRFNPSALTVKELSSILHEDGISFGYDDFNQWKEVGFKANELYSRQTFSIAKLKDFLKKRPEALDVYSFSEDTLDLLEIDIDDWPEPPNFKLIWCDKCHYGRISCFTLFNISCHCKECGLRLKRWANAYSQDWIS